MLPTAFTRLFLYGLLALAPWAVCAQTALQWATERDGLAGEVRDQPDDAADGPPMLSAVPSRTRSVKKLSDSELTCAQIHAETRILEKTSQAKQTEAMQAQEAMTEIQNEMMKQASGMGGGGMGSMVGSGLLGMIPGAGLVQGAVMQAANEARRASMQDGAHKMMQVQTRSMNAEQALEHAQARSEHLADLFLKKDCKLSQVK
jgi:hypothetical protein